jgi:hypothetical protein
VIDLSARAEIDSWRSPFPSSDRIENHPNPSRLAISVPTRGPPPLSDVFGGQPENQTVEVPTVRIDHAPQPALLPATEPPVEPDRRPIACVDIHGDLLVAEFLEMVAENCRDRGNQIRLMARAILSSRFQREKISQSPGSIVRRR